MIILTLYKVKRQRITTHTYIRSLSHTDTFTVWCQIFEEHNFHGFRRLASNCENYAP